MEVHHALVLLLVAACGGSSPPPAKIAIPDQPLDVGKTPTARPHDGGVEEPATVARPPLPPGADGPRDAKAILGELGDATAGLSPILLVNTREMRAHPKGETLGNIVVSALVGWNQFLPIDLIAPVRDTDWVLMAGDIHLGSTSRNVVLARYNVNESRADVVWKELQRRLPAKPFDTTVPGTKSLTATIDRAPRAYVRGKPGALAIVPAGSAKTAAQLVARVEAPLSVRKGELLRFSALDRAAIRAFEVPVDVRAFRVWVDVEDGRLFLHAEGDCDDGEGAVRAASELRASLDEQARRSPLAAIFAHSLLGGATVWNDGSVARYRGEIDDRILMALAAATAAMNP